MASSNLWSRLLLRQQHIRPLRKDKGIFSRLLAVPVNPSTSVDASLGTSVPAPPTASSIHSDEPPRSPEKEEDANVLAHIVKGKSTQNTHMPQKADIERVKNLATGDARRSVPLPDTASMLVKRLNDAMNYWDENPDVYHMASENKNIEQHHTVDHPSSAFSAMERYLISASRQILNMGKRSSSPADFQHIQSCMDASVNEQLDIELPYESVPKPERRVALTNAKSAPDDINTALDDGVLLLCYIEFSELGKEKISICSGFAVQGGDKLASTDTEASGPIIVSCAHTLESVMQNYVKPKGSSADNESIVLAMTRLGHIYPVHTLLSYLPGQDLSLFQLSPNAYSFDLDSFQVTPLHDTSMRTLPVSPYPAVINTELSVSSFGGWVPDATAGSFSIKEGLTQHDVVRNRWAHAKLTGYRDPIGRQAETGTYDELAQLDFQLDWDSEETPESLREAAMRSTAVFPIPGSSGGPVVDIHSGCVVGVVRGQRSSELGDVRGDAVPAEKIFECTYENDLTRSSLCPSRFGKA